MQTPKYYQYSGQPQAAPGGAVTTSAPLTAHVLSLADAQRSSNSATYLPRFQYNASQHQYQASSLQPVSIGQQEQASLYVLCGHFSPMPQEALPEASNDGEKPPALWLKVNDKTIINIKKKNNAKLIGCCFHNTLISINQ